MQCPPSLEGKLWPKMRLFSSARIEEASCKRPKAGTRPLSKDEVEAFQSAWRQGRPIVGHLPITFRSGSSMDTFTGHCPVCGTAMPDEDLRGRVTRPTPETAIVEACAPCRPCRIWVPFYFIVRTDPLRLEWPDHRTNEWLVSVGKPQRGPVLRALSWALDALLFRG